MKGFIKSKKGLALLASAVAVIVAAGGAYAYFTSSGSGSGTGTVGTSTGFTVAGGSAVGTLYPDTLVTGPDQGVITGASVTNPATAHGNEILNTIVATITVPAPPSPLPFPSEAACAATDFQFNSPTATWTGTGTQSASISPADDLAPGASYTISDLNIVMVDNNAPQDNCQGVHPIVTFVAS